jgi:hypothetical protein
MGIMVIIILEPIGGVMTMMIASPSSWEPGSSLYIITVPGKATGEER